ncbi:MAG: hypothetical protein JRG89_07020 [Deltaproteobacteria bacterium]|nr:hypothetical protein [Deltaproteobacteria bacterium]
MVRSIVGKAREANRLIALVSFVATVAAVARANRDDEERRVRRIGYKNLCTIEPPASVALWAGPQLDPLGLDGVVFLVNRQGCDLLSTRETRQPLGLLPLAARFCDCVGGDAGREKGERK